MQARGQPLHRRTRTRLAEGEVPPHAGARRGRLHRGPGVARGARLAAGRHVRGRAARVRGPRRQRVRRGDACSARGPARRASSSRRRRSSRRRASPGTSCTGPSRRSSSRSPSASGPPRACCASRSSSACARTRSRARSCASGPRRPPADAAEPEPSPPATPSRRQEAAREQAQRLRLPHHRARRPDHQSREAALPGLRLPQALARRVLRGDRAGDAAPRRRAGR